MVGAAINNAISVLDWLKNNIIGEDYLELFKLLDKSEPGANGLFCMPYLTGEREPLIGHMTSGTFLGIREYHKRGDIIRSVLEGVAYAISMIKDAFDENNVRFNEIRIGGAAAKYDSWVQIFANVLDTKVMQSPTDDAALIGSAILGYHILGEYPDIVQASSRMAPNGKFFIPAQELVPKYKKFASFYKDLYWSMEAVFRKHHDLNE